jgi:hypothetical protein
LNTFGALLLPPLTDRCQDPSLEIPAQPHSQETTQCRIRRMPATGHLIRILAA